MLVLSRKLGEKIMIGDDIEIIVARIERNSVRIAVSAPKEVAVYRGELRKQRKPPKSAKEFKAKELKEQGEPDDA